MKKMKKTVYILISVCVSLMTFSSCNYLDIVPDEAADVNDVYADRYTAIHALANLYGGMPYTPRVWENLGSVGAMEVIFNQYAWAASFEIAKNDYTSSGTPVNLWSDDSAGYMRSLYSCIYDCNVFLKNIDNVGGLEADEIERWRAEALVVKAYAHFYLLNMYGPIPLKDSNLSLNASNDDMFVRRQKVDDCFKYVIGLLDQAIDSEALPIVIVNKQEELGRFTRSAARSIKAKIMMYWASPMFNGNTDYSGFLNENNEPYFNQTYDATRWTKAADACKEAIDECTKAGIQLYQKADYKTALALPDQIREQNILRSAFSKRWNHEVIWTCSSCLCSTWINLAYSMPRFPGYTSGHPYPQICAPINTAEKFYSENGVPINEDKSFDYTHRYSTRVSELNDRYYVKQGESSAILNFNREPRFYATLGFDRGIWWGNAVKNEIEDAENCIYLKMHLHEESSFKTSDAFNDVGYFIKKYCNFGTMYTGTASFNYTSYVWPEMRYSDLLLLYAEALNESKSAPDASVYAPIDEVRARAGLKGVVESWNQYSTSPDKPSTKDGMREIIHRERFCELCAEQFTYWDMRRWKECSKELNQNVLGWNWQGESTDEYYQPITYYKQSYFQKNYLMPVPLNEININNRLIQNPGW